MITTEEGRPAPTAYCFFGEFVRRLSPDLSYLRKVTDTTYFYQGNGMGFLGKCTPEMIDECAARDARSSHKVDSNCTVM